MNPQRLETTSGTTRRLLTAALGFVLALLGLVVSAGPAAAQNRVGPQPFQLILTVGPETSTAPETAGVDTLPQLQQASAAGVAADSGMAGVRAAGQTGEDLAGIVKNTDHIPSASGTAAYRIPDELNASTLGEVKNVSSLSYTNQLRDFQAYAQSTGRTFNLYVRGSTTFSGPLQDAINAGQINVIRNLPG
jgi:hypothetical protein